jgi:hypothetical protein
MPVDLSSLSAISLCSSAHVHVESITDVAPSLTLRASSAAEHAQSIQAVVSGVWRFDSDPNSSDYRRVYQGSSTICESEGRPASSVRGYMLDFEMYQGSAPLAQTLRRQGIANRQHWLPKRRGGSPKPAWQCLRGAAARAPSAKACPRCVGGGLSGATNAVPPPARIRRPPHKGAIQRGAAARNPHAQLVSRGE